MFEDEIRRLLLDDLRDHVSSLGCHYVKSVADVYWCPNLHTSECTALTESGTPCKDLENVDFIVTCTIINALVQEWMSYLPRTCSLQVLMLQAGDLIFQQCVMVVRMLASELEWMTPSSWNRLKSLLVLPARILSHQAIRNQFQLSPEGWFHPF